MFFAVISDVVWQGVIAAAVTLALAWMNILNGRKADKVKADLELSNAAAKIKMDDLALKTDNLTVVADKTHTLVNSNMGAQLRLTSAVTRRLADLTKDPADRAAAVAADKLLAEHEKQQAKVDAKDAAATAAVAASQGK